MTAGAIRRSFFLAGVLFLPAAGPPYAAKLEAQSCRAAEPALVETLGAEWHDVSAYVEACPVPGPDGKIALAVAVVRIDRMLKARWFDAHANPHIPLPVMLGNDGRIIGTLPEGFPADLPGALRVTFEDWRGATPWRIDQYEGFETALPPHALAAQVWDPNKHLYRQLADQP